MRPARCILAAALACATPLAIEAHHGAAQFDPAKVITLKGTTVALHFTNPHAMINFEVKSPQGESVVWIGELQAPNILKRGGWNKFTLKPGDAVTVTGYPMKSGDPAIWVNKLTGPGGQDLPLFNH